MPLAFRSESHATVAFGFFNIDVDMLLLQNLFFFADDFCEAAASVLPSGEPGAQAGLPGWRIEDPGKIGDLHGAIQGVNLAGFLGETYRLFPFPARPEDFKQSPEGDRNREPVRAAIDRFGTGETFPLLHDDAGDVRIAEYIFSPSGFEALLDYVRAGGYPRWRDETPPAYVGRMDEALKRDRP